MYTRKYIFQKILCFGWLGLAYNSHSIAQVSWGPNVYNSGLHVWIKLLSTLRTYDAYQAQYIIEHSILKKVANLLCLNAERIFYLTMSNFGFYAICPCYYEACRTFVVSILQVTELNLYWDALCFLKKMSL